MSGEYVQTKKIDKAALKLTADPSNHGWSKDTQRFGYKMLLKMGWTEGKGLGSSEQGSTDHIKISKKDDKLGVGVEARGTETWIASSSSFNSILARLNAVYGPKTSSEPEKSKPETEDNNTDADAAAAAAAVEEVADVVDNDQRSERKRKKKEAKKMKKKRKAAEADEEQENGEVVDESKATEEALARDEVNENENEEEKKEQQTEKTTEQPVRRHKYHKMLRAKTVSSYSADDLNAILGTMRRQQKQAEETRVAAIEAEQDSLVPITVSKTSVHDYFNETLKAKSKKST